MFSLQDCLDALERGQELILADGATARRAPNGEYIYEPYISETIVALGDTTMRTDDLFTFLALIAFRDAYVQPVYVESHLVREG